MAYEIEMREVAPRILATAGDQANYKNIAEKIGKLFETVTGHMKTSGMHQSGPSVVLYLPPDGNGGAFMTDEGVPIKAGAEVQSAFEDADPITCFMMPTGVVASTLHIGPYHCLGEAHRAIHIWSTENNRPITGSNWEIYHHWSDNPEELRTEVQYLLR